MEYASLSIREFHEINLDGWIVDRQGKKKDGQWKIWIKEWGDSVEHGY
jgi:hypothetical protein